MTIQWHKIDNEKINKIYNSCLIEPDVFDDKKFFDLMSKNSGMKLNKNYCLPEKFTWEDGYQAGLPRENEKEYLVYFVETDSFAVAIYDNEQDYGPCFWENDGVDLSEPDYWAELEKPVLE